MADKVRKSEAEWRRELSPEQFRITREKGTERAFSGRLAQLLPANASRRRA